MISCTEFIMAYSELFKFLHERHGHAAVVKFWEGISDEFLWNLRDLVKAKGIQGMKEYWGHTLTEEGADCKVEATEDTFTIHMHRCPSVGILRRATHMQRYPDYCNHCDTLYRRIMEPLGFSYEIEYLDEQAGHCRVTIRKR
ncbi:MAG: hypothetical protein FJ279_08390 [Planctomycetes bacterium]|nr:hypothetical protein [Planctomycetota bacterium]MBM4084289.1 hypothetical protein [Planctomycetota bacterium]